MDEQQLQSLAKQLRKPEGEDGIKTAAFMNKGNLRINMDALKAVKARPGDNILEIGMGNGAFVKEILSIHPSIKYTGCDYSALMVQEAKKTNTEYIKNGQAVFCHASAEQLPIVDSSVDKLFTINTLYFWENPVKILTEFGRVLKTDGKLFIVVRPKRQMEQFAFIKYGFTPYSKEEIAELLKKNNFIVTDTIENNEPDAEVNGTIIKMENLIVIAQKK